VSGFERGPRTKNVACANCAKRFIKLAIDRSMVCLRCVTWARLTAAGLVGTEPGVTQLAAYNDSVRAKAERKAA
jgi:hypothetical protein